MKHRADIDQAMTQMDLASSGSSSESSLTDSSDLSSPSKDDSEGSSSLDALGQPATSSTSMQDNIGFTWTNQDNIPYIHSFSGTPGIKANLSSILDIFQAFVPNDMIDLIVDETNRYAASKPSKRDPLKRRHDIEWKDVSSAEVKVVFGLCKLMGVVQKPVIKLYWSTKAMLATPFYLEVMSSDIFCKFCPICILQIMQMTMVVIDSSKFGKLWKQSFQILEKRLLLMKTLLLTNHC